MKLKRESPTLKISEKIEILEQITEELTKLRDHNIIHGDLKPHNILLTKGLRPILTDFGTAVVIRKYEKIAKPFILQYTPAYAAPETIEEGKISKSSDVYSLATLIIELLTGERTPSQSIGIPAALYSKIKSLKGGTKLYELISRMRNKNPENRLTALEVLENLRRI